jgi:DNA mismatch repair protein MutL
VPIHVLPPEVADKIAAGEVVERPASVVKELVENAIDAGARNVRVEARDGGQRLIRVTDDGTGIPHAEVPLAFARHATSKLTSIDDLEHIQTLGFRGEALASIAAVSRLTMVSRTAHAAGGALIRLEGGRQVRFAEHGAPPGTSVSVENLFYNVPARLKFLKAPATEAGHIHRVVTRYAMAFPEIRFQLLLNERVALQTTGQGSLYDVLLEVLGLDACHQLIALPDAEAGVLPGRSPRPLVTGYVGRPSLHHAQRDHIILFVNRRWVQDRLLTAAVVQAYHTLLPAGRYPVAVLSVTIDPGEVDVNVHPTKSEVKFRDQQAVFGALQKAVRAIVISCDEPPQLAVRPGAPSRELSGTSPYPDEHYSVGAAAGGWRRLTQFGFEVQRTAPEGSTGDQPPFGRLPLLRVLGQLAQTYVIAEGPDGMYLIDQHAAHERVLYEQLQRQRATLTVSSQQLLAPAVLDLTPGQAAVLDAEADVLAQLGFDIEPFGGYTYRLRAVPELLVSDDPAAALSDILAEMAEGVVPLARRAEERVMTTVCKRAAIKAGQSLSLREQQELVHSLEQCESPRTCPHGRPTMLHLSSAQLAREFGRA